MVKIALIKSRLFCCIVLLLTNQLVSAQETEIHKILHGVDSTGSPVSWVTSFGAVGTSNQQVPFWMRCNQFGSVPNEGFHSPWSIQCISDSIIGKKLIGLLD